MHQIASGLSLFSKNNIRNKLGLLYQHDGNKAISDLFLYPSIFNVSLGD